MKRIKKLGVIVGVAGLLAAGAAELSARTKKGDKYFAEGRRYQLEEKWDLALEAYEKALGEDPADAAYQMAVRRTRFQAGQMHVRTGKKLRDEGKLEEALAEFQKAYIIDPSSTIAEQELRTTYRMIRRREREREKKENGAEEEPEAKVLTPVEEILEETRKRLAALQPPPRLKPISRQLNTLKITNQPVKVLYETVGKVAGINVVFDPDFQDPGKRLSVDLSNTTLEEALRYLAVLTKTYWKPLSENTIFVTNDNVTKRRDYEEQVVKVFYLKNITKVQELQEIATAVRSVTDIRRLFTYNSQNAILVRGEADKVALAEKLIHDLDKPLAEVVVDVIVMEANRTRTRELAASLISGGKPGLSLPISFAPGGASIQPIGNGGDGGDGGGGSGGTSIPLGQIGRLDFNDWRVTLPGMLLQALMTDRTTRILQRPQVRAADGQKASLRLGDRIPFATGSFQPGVGAVGVSPLVSTQFQYADVGVNVDLTPKIHGDDEVSLHIEIEISAVRERIDVGGIQQPIIGQRKITEDIRVKDGEVTLLGGLTQDQRTRTRSGIPGLGDIPIIKWLGFSSEGRERNEGELLIALIPHIVRRPEISEINLKPVAAGSDQVVRVRYAPIEEEEPEETPQPEAPPPAAAPAGAPEPPAPKPPEAAKPAVPETGAALRFMPAAVEVKRGGTFSVSLVIENATDIYNAPMKFRFDPKFLRMTGITQGNLLSGDGRQVIFTRNILNDAGTASIVMNRLPGAGGVSGTGTLVTLTFQALTPGRTEVAVPELTIRDSQMRPVAVSPPRLTVSIQE